MNREGRISSVEGSRVRWTRFREQARWRQRRDRRRRRLSWHSYDPVQVWWSTSTRYAPVYLAGRFPPPRPVRLLRRAQEP